MPVLALDFHMTPASAKYLADKAKSAGRLLTLINVVVPIALVVIGAVLAVVAVIRRRKPVPPGPSAAETHSSQRAMPLDTALLR
jgi:heme/copper-type cytochrome/quinol oxidase subunit 2